MNSIVKVKICCFFILILPFHLTDGFSIEEKLQQLTENYIEIKEVLSAKVTQLEFKVMGLEEKVEQQQSLLNILQGKLKETAATNSITNIDRQSANAKSSVQRTCHETRLADPSMTSGWHWIDPDGQGVGDDPIYVYCDADTGSTSVPHDSESKINVGHCEDPGCYSRIISYSASSRQLSALNELSAECHQSIQYDCNYAPFEFDGVRYSWWNDKSGNPQYFWAGGDASIHTCQCGIDQNCLESNKKCNCDSLLPLPLSDTGIISNKNYLPITRLNFGRTLLLTSSGEHTLGKFSCTGQVSISGMPKSCKDLWLIGHTLSGLYSVAGTKQVESVYCDFSKQPEDLGFQTLIGYEDVQSSPTYFYVQKNRTFNVLDTPIPFEVEKLNIGNGMNLTSGIFTAPKAGRYFFSFTGVALITSSTSASYLNICLYLNGAIYGEATTRAINEATNDMETLSLVSTLDLKVRDQVWLQMWRAINANLYDDDNDSYDTHFTGWLLQEDIVF